MATRAPPVTKRTVPVGRRRHSGVSREIDQLFAIATTERGEGIRASDSFLMYGGICLPLYFLRSATSVLPQRRTADRPFAWLSALSGLEIYEKTR